MKSGKAAGVNGIPTEVWKYGGPALHTKLHELFVCCWEQGLIPQYLHDALIITLYKNKEDWDNAALYFRINPGESPTEQTGTCNC